MLTHEPTTKIPQNTSAMLPMSKAKCRFKITISVAQEQALMILHITWKFTNNAITMGSIKPALRFRHQTTENLCSLYCILTKFEENLIKTKFWVWFDGFFLLFPNRILPVIGKNGGTLGMVPLMVPYDFSLLVDGDLDQKCWIWVAEKANVRQVYGSRWCSASLLWEL